MASSLFSTLFSTRSWRVRWLLGGAALLAAALVIAAAVRTSLVESSGAGGVLGLFFVFASLLVLVAHAIWRRREKGTVRLAMVALAMGLLALTTSAALARANRTEAAEVATSDTTYAPGERESRVAKANERADNAAWIGLAGVVPAALALFALVLAIGDRREMTPLLPKRADSASPPRAAPAERSRSEGEPEARPVPLNAIWGALFSGCALLALAIAWSVGALR